MKPVMQAVEITTPGAPQVLTPVQRPIPQPQAGEVLIKVHAAGVNRPDVIQRKGHYPPPAGASDLPGLEVAGEIVGGDAQAGGFGLRLDRRGRLRAVLCGARAAVPAGSRRVFLGSGRRAAGNLLYRVEQRV